jgi:hypothetical protein
VLPVREKKRREEERWSGEGKKRWICGTHVGLMHWFYKLSDVLYRFYGSGMIL